MLCKPAVILAVLIFGSIHSSLWAVEKTDATKIEIDTDKMDKKYTKEPEFSSDSADQKDANKVIQKNEEKFTGIIVGHTEELFKCGKLGKIEEVNKCKKNIYILQKIEAKK